MLCCAVLLAGARQRGGVLRRADVGQAAREGLALLAPPAGQRSQRAGDACAGETRCLCSIRRFLLPDMV